MGQSDPFQATIQDIVEFRDARDWARFHTPRNLAVALGVEIAELQEQLLWMTDSEVRTHLDDIQNWKAAAEELGDILIYTLLLCHEMGVDPREAIYEKLVENEIKYPVELARGRATKYNKLNTPQ